MSAIVNNWGFPVLLALLLGGVGFWLDQSSQISLEEVALNPAQPQYQLEGIQARMFGKDGQVAQSLVAQSAWQFPKRTDAYMQQPEIVFTPAGVEKYRIKADEAHYLPNDHDVVFTGNVVLTTPKTAQAPAATLQTNSITVNTETQVAQTKDLVRYRYGLSTGEAQGLVYDQKNGLLNLHSRIKAVIYEP